MGTTKFVYDGADVVRDLDANGATIADYLNELDIDSRIRQTVSGSSSYFLTDYLDTTRALTDPSGSVTSSLSYDSFGNITSGAAPTRYTYTGREIDSDVGLMYYRARFYDPQQGRFISEDPIGLEGGINVFAYVENKPLRFIDLSGLCAQNPKPCDTSDEIRNRKIASLTRICCAYIHTHAVFYMKGKRVDPRTIFCKEFGFRLRRRLSPDELSSKVVGDERGGVFLMSFCRTIKPYC